MEKGRLIFIIFGFIENFNYYLTNFYENFRSPVHTMEVKYLKYQLESILSQTLKELTRLLCDDGSIDTTVVV